MNDQNKPLTGELSLIDALNRVAAQYGVDATLKIVEQWKQEQKA